MSWTAIVPLKEAPDRKTRLGQGMAAEQRIALSERMARHVVTILRKTPGIDRVFVHSPRSPVALDAEWSRDMGTGLNAELDRVRAAGLNGSMLFVHADLPLLAEEDIASLMQAAESEGVAIAPDRHGDGTNAIALADARPFAFSFGKGSFAAHCNYGPCAVVRRPGLSLDIDTPEDLDAARAAGLHIEV